MSSYPLRFVRWLSQGILDLKYPTKTRAAFVSFAAMSCELEFKTLHGGVITLETMMETTLGELKTMLLDRHPRAEDPIERKLLRVELLQDCSIMEMEDAQTLGATGLLEAEAPTTVIYKRNEAEASKKRDVHALGFFTWIFPQVAQQFLAMPSILART